MCLGPPEMAIIAQRFNAGLSLQRGQESRWDERNSRKLGKILSSLPGLKHWPFPRTQPSKGWAIFRFQCVGTLNTYLSRVLSIGRAVQKLIIYRFTCHVVLTQAER